MVFKARLKGRRNGRRQIVEHFENKSSMHVRTQVGMLLQPTRSVAQMDHGCCLNDGNPDNCVWGAKHNHRKACSQSQTPNSCAHWWWRRTGEDESKQRKSGEEEREARRTAIEREEEKRDRAFEGGRGEKERKKGGVGERRAGEREGGEQGRRAGG